MVMELSLLPGIFEEDISSDEVRILMGQFTLIYETVNGDLVDTSPDFMKNRISEHFLFMMILRKVSRTIASQLAERSRRS